MHPQIKIVAQTADGAIVPIIVSPDGSLIVGGSASGGGDASATNQLAEIERLIEVRTAVASTEVLRRVCQSCPIISNGTLQLRSCFAQYFRVSFLHRSAASAQVGMRL